MHACVVSFKPDMEKTDQRGLRDAKVAVQKLEHAINQMRGGAGYCGSMATHSRWTWLLTDKLEQALYRPWAVKYNGAYWGNSHGLYEQTIKNLKVWSLTGINQSEAFDSYNKQLVDSTQALARFYQHNYK